jgi:hypothetical protein
MVLSEAQRQRRMAFLVERQNVDLATHVEMEAQFSASQHDAKEGGGPCISTPFT